MKHSGLIKDQQLFIHASKYFVPLGGYSYPGDVEILPSHTIVDLCLKRRCNIIEFLIRYRQHMCLFQIHLGKSTYWKNKRK